MFAGERILAERLRLPAVSKRPLNFVALNFVKYEQMGAKFENNKMWISVVLRCCSSNTTHRSLGRWNFWNISPVWSIQFHATLSWRWNILKNKELCPSYPTSLISRISAFFAARNLNFPAFNSRIRWYSSAAINLNISSRVFNRFSLPHLLFRYVFLLLHIHPDKQTDRPFLLKCEIAVWKS